MSNPKRKAHKNNQQSGFTIIELIVVIAILGVMAAFIVPNYIEYIDTARLASDKASVKTLNDATLMYATDNGKYTTQVFSGVSSDSDKMMLLLGGGYIGAIPTPKRNNTVFMFSQSNGLWALSTNVVFYSDFSSISNVKSLTGTWDTINGQLTPTKTGENRALFQNTSGTDYNIKIEAKYLSGSASQSGYGVYYRATDSANISGYCFQFDPGAGNSFTVRKVTNGKEAAAFQSESMSKIFPSGFDITATHNIEIEVIGTQHVIKVDGTQVLNFTDSTFTEGSVGVRTWSNSKTQFSESTVTNR